MAFRVEIAEEAYADLDAIAEYIQQRGSPESANRWFDATLRDIHSLAETPTRCPVAPGMSVPGYEVRILLSGRRNRMYKIYFLLRHDVQVVYVLHIRHWARQGPEIDTPPNPI
ncbi:hypothetical protein F183_A47250 [Bryobacterales bacterium F-183]|nr:hypothetical protein F183_A47250 [Bryobacterales bacterium F-183]